MCYVYNIIKKSKYIYIFFCFQNLSSILNKMQGLLIYITWKGKLKKCEKQDSWQKHWIKSPEQVVKGSINIRWSERKFNNFSAHAHNVWYMS